MATASQQDLEYQAELDRSRRQGDEEAAPDLGFDDEGAAATASPDLTFDDEEIQAEAGLNMARAAAMQQQQAMQQAQAGEMARAAAVDKDNKDTKKSGMAWRKKILIGIVRVSWLLNPVLFYQLTYGLIIGYVARGNSRFFRETIPLPELGEDWAPNMPPIARLGFKIGSGMSLIMLIPFALWWTLMIGFFICAIYLAFEILKAIQDSWIGELYDYAASIGS